MKIFLRKKAANKDLIAFFLFLIIISFFFSRLFIPEPSIFITPEYSRSDITYFNYPIKDFLSRSLKSFQLPLWNSKIGMGFPILAESQIGVFFVPNLILFGLLPTWLAFNLSYILSFLLASMGMYFLGKRLKFSFPASLLIGIVYPFSGFFMGHIQHLNVLQATSLLPWVIYLGDIMFQKKNIKNIAVFSLVLSQQIFAGHLQIPALSLILLGLLTIYFSKLKLKSIIINWCTLLISFIVSLLLCLVQIIPSSELISLSIRSKGFDSSSLLQYSFPIKNFLTLFNPFLFGSVSNGSYSSDMVAKGSIFWENIVYIGLLPIILIIVSLFKLKKNILFQVLIFILVISTLMMLGKNSPTYFVHTIPPLNFFRDPSRYILIFTATMILMAGLGMNYLNNHLFKNTPIRLKTLFNFLIIIIIIANFFFYWFNYQATSPIRKWLDPPEIAKYLNHKKDNKYRVITLPNSGLLWSGYYPKYGWKNKEPYYYFRNDLTPNINLVWNISIFDSYVGVVDIKRTEVLKNLIYKSINKDVQKDKILVLNKNAFQLLNLGSISYIVSSYTINNPDLKLVYISKYFDKKFPVYNIYFNNKSIPRINIVNSYLKADTLEDMQNAMNSSEFSPEKQVILEKNIKGDLFKEKSLEYKITWLKDYETENIIKTTSSSNGILVFRDTYYPGWKAFIDNKETEIYAANLAQRAIFLPAGTHIVKFIYQPNLFYLGLAISLIVHLILLFPIIKNFRK